MKMLNNKIKKAIKNRLVKEISLMLTLVFSFQFLLVPSASVAQASDFSIGFIEIQKSITNHLPENPTKQLEVDRVYNLIVTAYNAGDVNQCWGDPCLSANGENICEALKQGYKRCAANFVPFGTILNIEGYGQCMVTDRMNARYTYRVDIAMTLEQKQEAKEWGAKYLQVEVLKYN